MCGTIDKNSGALTNIAQAVYPPKEVILKDGEKSNNNLPINMMIIRDMMIIGNMMIIRNMMIIGDLMIIGDMMIGNMMISVVMISVVMIGNMMISVVVRMSVIQVWAKAISNALLNRKMNVSVVW